MRALRGREGVSVKTVERFGLKGREGITALAVVSQSIFLSLSTVAVILRL